VTGTQRQIDTLRMRRDRAGAGPHEVTAQDYYLDEYTFRFNRRHSRHAAMLFYRLLEQAARPIRTHSRRSTAQSPKRQSPPDFGGADHPQFIYVFARDSLHEREGRARFLATSSMHL
jgi:hypothetical protein